MPTAPDSRPNRMLERVSSCIRCVVPPAIAALFARYAPKSLTTRILLLQLAWAFVIYVLVIAALWFATSLVIERSVRHQAEGWIAKLDELGIPIYATDNPRQLKEAISYLRNFPEIAQARYLDESGASVIAEYSRKGDPGNSFAPLNAEIIHQLTRSSSEQKNLRFEKGA